jgi:hypothetical protein
MNKTIAPLPILGEHPDNYHLRWNLPLPSYIDVDRLGVHLPTVNTLAYLSGTREIIVLPGKLSEDETPLIGGSSGVGEGVALATASLAPPKEQTGSGERVPIADTDILADARLRIDIDKIAGHLGRKQQLRSTEAWGNQLNYAVARGLGHIVTRNTCLTDKGSSAVQLFLAGSWYSVARTFELLTGTGEDVPEMMLALAAVFRPYTMMNEAKRAGVPLGQVPWSVLPFSLDRLLAAKAYQSVHRRPIRTLAE